MKPFLPFFLVLSSLLAPWSIATATPAEPGLRTQESSDVPADPAVVWGRLENGLRYAILPNAVPKDHVSLRLVVAVGSLHETEAQRGLARFVARMGYRGTKHFPPGELDSYLQGVGMKPGADGNAAVSFDLTAFKLELPAGDPATLPQALTVLRDFADGMLFSAPELETERKAVLAQNAEYRTVEYRGVEDNWSFLLPGALVPRRFPLGQDEAIRSATREQLLDFYATWYRPERMTVVVVGAVTPAEVTRQLAAALNDLQDRAAARPEPDRGPVAATATTTAHLHSDPEDVRIRISLQTVAPYSSEPDTMANRLKYVPRELAYAMLNRRFAKLNPAGGPEARARTTEWLDCARISSIDTLIAEDGPWRPALARVEQELRRALEHGFNAGELRDVVALTTKSWEQSVDHATSRPSASLADQLGQAITGNRVFASTPAMADAVLAALHRTTPEACRAALREAWAPPGRVVYVTGKLTLPQPEEELLGAFNGSLQVPVAPLPNDPVPVWAYADFGRPGRIVHRAEVPDLGIVEVEFENGVRVNLKRAGSEANSVRINARVGGGMLTLPKEKPGLQALALAAAEPAGLGKHSADEIRRMFLDRSVRLTLNVGQDAFVLSGDTATRDLELELQWLAARLSDPGFQQEANDPAHRTVKETCIQSTYKPEGLRLLEIERAVAGGDPRFGLPDWPTLSRYTMDDLRTWLEPELTTGAVEIALVGDCDPETAIALAAKTVGALPARKPKPAFAEERRVAFPAVGSDQTRRVQTTAKLDCYWAYWPTEDATDPGRTRRLALLAAIFEQRLRDIDREGKTMTKAEAANISSDTFPGFGYLRAKAEAKTEHGVIAVGSMRAIAADLQANGVTREEIDRARTAMLEAHDRSVQTNAYWAAAVLGAAQEFPQRLDWHRTLASDLAAVTREEVSALAALYLRNNREMVFQALAVPMPKPGEE